MSSDFETLLEQADAAARAGEHAPAAELYGRAFDAEVPDEVGAERAFWAMMGWMNALFLAGEHGRALHVAVAAFDAFEEEGLVVGNPFFHLRAGQAKYELTREDERAEQGPGTAIDELTRALVGGGVAFFDGEDPKYLALATDGLEPPEGFESWEASRGEYDQALDALNGAAETPLADLFESKLGVPPPYSIDDEDEEDDDDADDPS